jgi:hypothetical protein
MLNRLAGRRLLSPRPRLAGRRVEAIPLELPRFTSRVSLPELPDLLLNIGIARFADTLQEFFPEIRVELPGVFLGNDSLTRRDKGASCRGEQQNGQMPPVRNAIGDRFHRFPPRWVTATVGISPLSRTYSNGNAMAVTTSKCPECLPRSPHAGIVAAAAQEMEWQNGPRTPWDSRDATIAVRNDSLRKRLRACHPLRSKRSLPRLPGLVAGASAPRGED